jgi:TolA-binding protein
MSADHKETAVPLAEISQGPNAFEAFLDRNQKGLIALTVVLALACAGVVVYRGIESERQKGAGNDLVKAADLAAYQAVADNHANTAAGGSALILLANSQWKEGKKDEAAATLRKFIDTYPEHPALPEAKASLGSKLMAQGKSGDATKLFEELVSDPKAKYIAPFALISLGDIAKAAGDIEKAEKSYSEVKSQFPDSNFASAAGERIASPGHTGSWCRTDRCTIHFRHAGRHVSCSGNSGRACRSRPCGGTPGRASEVRSGTLETI